MQPRSLFGNEPSAFEAVVEELIFAAAGLITRIPDEVDEERFLNAAERLRNDIFMFTDGQRIMDAVQRKVDLEKANPHQYPLVRIGPGGDYVEDFIEDPDNPGNIIRKT
jgi:hypothetical protein|tara:strand:+ start:180 stop:506 length:327 start_codon:yes stop_codon:yes gene_type:complete